MQAEYRIERNALIEIRRNHMFTGAYALARQVARGDIRSLKCDLTNRPFYSILSVFRRFDTAMA